MQLVTPSAAKARVGFVVPQWIAEPDPDVQGLPFRAITVASALFEAGYEVLWFDQLHDVTLNDRTAELGVALDDVQVVFVWLNELNPGIQFANVLEITRALKAARPGLRVIVGGPPVSILSPEFLTADAWPVDAFLRGVGEHGAPRAADAVHGHGTWADVPGLVTGDGRRVVAPGSSRAPIRREHLSLYRELDLSPYIQRRGGIFGNGEDTLAIATGWGCGKGCAFCYWSNFAPDMLPADDVVDLVADLRAAYGVRQFHIAELDFFARRSRPLELAERWRRDVPDCTWFALTSPYDCLRHTDDEWDTLAAGGCRKLEFGTESGSDRMLARIGKRHTAREPYDLARRLLARGISTMHNFIFGFVDETEADRRASLDLIHDLHALDPERVYFTFRFFQPGPGIPMGDEAIAHTRSYPRSLDEMLAYRGVAGRASESAMPWLSPREERRIKHLVYYELPMVTSRLEVDGGARDWAYRRLRTRARRRLRRQERGGGLDAWLFRRVFDGARLDNTFLA